MATDFGRLTVWADGDGRELANYTTCGYVWPAASSKVIDLRFYVQHVRAASPQEAKETGLRIAREAAGLAPADPGVGFAVFEGHHDELSFFAKDRS